MKTRTLLLAILFVALAGMIGAFFIGGTLQVEVQTMTANAADYPEAYASIVNVVSGGTAPIYFAQTDFQDSRQYTLLDVTLNISNPGFIPAEWLEVTTGGISGDIAVYSLTGSGSTLEGRSEGQMNLKLITTANASAARVYTLEYYVLGMKRSVKIS